MCVGIPYPDNAGRVGKRYLVKEPIGINISLGILPNTTFTIINHKKVIEFGSNDKTGESYEIKAEPEINVLGSGLSVRYEWQNEDVTYHYFKIAFETALINGRIIELC